MVWWHCSVCIAYTSVNIHIDPLSLINPLSTEYEVAHCLDISRPKVLAADVSTWPTLYAAAKRQNLSELKGISFDDAPCPAPNVCILSTHNFRDIDWFKASTLYELCSQRQRLPAFDLSQKDSREHTGVVCFSSGTSGKAKGVELSHYNLVASMLGCRTTDPIYWNGNIRSVFFAPLCHIYGESRFA